MNKKRLTTYIISSVVIFILTAALLSIGFFVGFWKADSSDNTQIPALSESNVDADFAIFWEAFNRLKDTHVLAEDFDDQDFVYGAIAGLAGTFKDPNTNFFSPKEATKFEEDVTGNFGGIGAEIGKKDGILSIVTPLKDSPAEMAGIKAGDFILMVDGARTEGISVNEAVMIIRGEIGTPVVLNIFRESWAQAKDITIIRNNITIPTLDSQEFDDGNIVQIQLFSFNENAPLKFYQTVVAAVLGGADGLILDLRNNPGGFLEVANNLAGWWLDRGDIVVSEKFREGPNKDFRASGNEALKEMPTVILINEGSASASEILAGALRDHLGTKIIGKKSFGKGTVQELVSLKDNSSLKITVANWVMPSGVILEGNGIEPDYEIDITEEDFKDNKDPQLDKALEVLRELL